jgi:hypothetical protein
VDKFNNRVKGFFYGSNRALVNLLNQAKIRKQNRDNVKVVVYPGSRNSQGGPPGGPQGGPPGGVPGRVPGRVPGENNNKTTEKDKADQVKEAQDKAAQDKAQREKIDAKLKAEVQNVVKQDFNQPFTEAEAQAAAQAELEKSSLKYLLGFGGDDGWINNMVNMLRNFGAKETKKPNVSTNDNTTYDEFEKPPESNYQDKYKWCKDNATKWVMHGEKITVLDEYKDVLTTKDIESYGCNQKSLFIDSIRKVFTILDGITSQGFERFLGIVKVILGGLASLFNTCCILGNGFCCTLAGYANWVIAWLTLMNGPLLELSNCMSHAFMYFFCKSVDNIYENTDDAAKFNLGNTLIQFSFLHFKKEFVKKMGNNKSCDTTLRAFTGNPNSLLALLNQTQIKIETNIAKKNDVLYIAGNDKKNDLLYINLGVVDPYIASDKNPLLQPDLSPVNQAAVIVSLLNIDEERQKTVEYLKTKINNNKIKTCSNYDGFDIVDAIILEIQNFSTNNSSQIQFVTIDMFFCKVFRERAPSFNDLSSPSWWTNFLFYSWWSKGELVNRMTTGILVPLMEFIIPKKNALNFVLTMLFGNSSPKNISGENMDKVNFNIMRDLLNESIDKIIAYSTVDGKIDRKKLAQIMKKDFSDVMEKFLGIWWGLLVAIIFGSDYDTPIYEFKTYDDYISNCSGKNKNCYKNENETNSGDHMKEYIRKALCEIIQNSNLDKHPDVLGIDINILNTICDATKFYQEYGVDTSQNDLKFEDLIKTICTSINDAQNQKTQPYEDIWVNDAFNYKGNPLLKKDINNNFKQRYFTSLCNMIKDYNSKPYIPKDKVQLQKLIADKVNNTENIVQEGLWNQFIEEMNNKYDTNNTSSTTPAAPAAIGLNLLKVKICNDNQKLIFIPVTDLSKTTKPDATYMCVSNDKYEAEYSTFEKDLEKKIEDENNKNQIKIIEWIIFSLEIHINNIRNNDIDDENENLKNLEEGKLNNVKKIFDRINNKKFSEEAISKEAIGKEEAAEMIQLINELNSEINESNSKNMESDNLPDLKLINDFIDKLNAKKLQNQLQYNSAVNSLEEIQPPLDTILTFLKHYTEENEMDNSLLSEIESLAETLKMDAQNKVEITDEDIQKMRDNIKTLLDYILQNQGKGSDIFKLQHLKDLTEKISKDNLLIKEEDREKINELKNDIENNKIYILDDERLKLSYAQLYFSDILNNVSPNDIGYSAFMYQKFFVGDKESNHMYQIIDLLHKLDSSNPTYTLNDNDIDLIMRSDDIILTNENTENIKQNITNLFNNKDFRKKLYKLLISKVEPPSYIKNKKYYDIEPNTTPIVDGKPLKYAGDLFSGVNRGVTPVTYDPQAHIDVYNQMYSYYGGRAVLCDSGEYRLIPITDTSGTFWGFEIEPYINNIKTIVSKNGSIDWTQGKTKKAYSNKLVGDAKGYEADLVGNIDVGLVRLGPPPIVVDIGNKFKLDIATGFREVLYNILYGNSYRPLIQKKEDGTTAEKADELTKASTKILEKYEAIEIDDKSTVYLLKADIANYQQMFKEFSPEAYAKSLYEAEVAKNTECDKITQADVNKEEKDYYYGFKSSVSDYHKWCKNDIAVKVNYLDTLKVKGIKNDKGESMTIPEMRDYLNHQYINSSVDQNVKDNAKYDIEQFLNSFITSILFKRYGTVDGILDQNITLGPDGKYKITNTIPGGQEANIDV